jgi:hypothetical protein
VLFKERAKGLKYNKEIAIVFAIVKDLTIKQQIKDAYLRNVKV